MSLFWLSFCDSARPRGKQFLGACIVEGGDTGDERDDFRVAIQNAHRLDCNPGGEVQGSRFMPQQERFVASRWKHRVLSRPECEAFDEAWRVGAAN